MLPLGCLPLWGREGITLIFFDKTLLTVDYLKNASTNLSNFNLGIFNSSSIFVWFKSSSILSVNSAMGGSNNSGFGFILSAITAALVNIRSTNQYLPRKKYEPF